MIRLKTIKKENINKILKNVSIVKNRKDIYMETMNLIKNGKHLNIDKHIGLYSKFKKNIFDNKDGNITCNVGDYITVTRRKSCFSFDNEGEIVETKNSIRTICYKII